MPSVQIHEQLESLFDELCESIDSLTPQMIELRRELHQHPEVSGQEFETTERIRDQFLKLNLVPRISPSGRGLTLDLQPGSPMSQGPGCAIRADIDALPIQDAKEATYASRCDHVMHACGHDAHAAIVFGASIALQKILSQRGVVAPGIVRAIFQPAEEICGGAKQMIAEGAVEGIDAAFAIHMDPNNTVGNFGYRKGILTAICDELVIEVRGKGGHGARPHLGRDPIAAAAQLIQAAYSQIPRALNPQYPHVLSFCEIRSGHSANVIPDHALIRGTLRTVKQSARDRAIDLLNSLGKTISVSTGCDVRLSTGVHSPAVKNDSTLTDLMVEAAGQLVPADRVKPIEFPSMGGEDFAYYGSRCATAMVRIGCRPESIESMDLHSPLFDVDENVLALGAKFLAWTTLLWLRDQSATA